VKKEEEREERKGRRGEREGRGVHKEVRVEVRNERRYWGEVWEIEGREERMEEIEGSGKEHWVDLEIGTVAECFILRELEEVEILSFLVVVVLLSSFVIFLSSLLILFLLCLTLISECLLRWISDIFLTTSFILVWL
jgi:hypothetical protein